MRASKDLSEEWEKTLAREGLTPEPGRDRFARKWRELSQEQRQAHAEWHAKALELAQEQGNFVWLAFARGESIRSTARLLGLSEWASRKQREELEKAVRGRPSPAPRG